MSVEEDLKQFILQKYKSIRAFTQEIDIPYSTVDTMFKRGIQGAGVGNVLKICKALGIDVDALDEGIIKPKDRKNNNVEEIFNIPSHSSEVTVAYENADFKTKNNVRFLLGLPLLKEEIAAELTPSTEPQLTAEDERELEQIRQEMLAEKRGRTSSASTSAKDA